MSSSPNQQPPVDSAPMISMTNPASSDVDIDDAEVALLNDHANYNEPITEPADDTDKVSRDNEASSEKSNPLHTKRNYLLIAFITASLWLTNSSLLFFQSNLAAQISSDERQKEVFEHCVSAHFFGALCFKLGHNLFFYFLSSPKRATLSMLLYLFCVLFVLVVYFMFAVSNAYYAAIPYFLSGVGFGTFEPNLLTSILPFGETAKLYALYGISVGNTAMQLGGYGLLAAGCPLVVVYLIATLCIVTGIVLYYYLMKTLQQHNDQQLMVSVNNEKPKGKVMSLQQLKMVVVNYKQWLPRILLFSFYMTCNTFISQFASSMSSYVIYSDDGRVPLLVTNGEPKWVVNRSLYMSVTAFFGLIGHLIGSRFAYKTKLTAVIGQQYTWLVVLMHLVLGVLASCVLFIQPLLIMVCLAFLSMTNFWIYSSGIKFIDSHVDEQYNLVALSTWLTISAFGQLIAQNTFEPVLNYVCNRNTYSFYCDKK